MLKKSSYGQQIILLLVVALIPLLMLSIWPLTQKRAEYIAATEAQSRAKISAAIRDFIDEVQKERELTAAVMTTSHEHFRKDLNSQRLLTKQSAKELARAIIQINGEPKLLDDHKASIQTIAQCRDDVDQNKNTGTVLKRYTDVAKTGLESTSQLARETGDDETMHLAIAAQLLNRAKEAAGLELALVTSIGASGTANAQKISIVNMLHQSQKENLDFCYMLAPVHIANHLTDIRSSAAFKSAEDISKRVRFAAPGSIAFDEEQWWKKQNAKLNELRSLEALCDHQIADNCQSMAAESVKSIWMTVSVATIPFFLISGFGLWIRTRLKNDTSRLENSIRNIANGRIDMDLQLNAPCNEVERIAAQFKFVVQRLEQASQLCDERTQALQRVGSQVRNHAVKISDSMNASNQSSIAVSQSADKSQNSIRDVEKTVEHVQLTLTQASTSMDSLTEELQRSNLQMSEATDSTIAAVELVRNSESQMKDLRSAASEITDVIDLIKEIAEQTNLLSLNATIEAARAGEAGKGFAVVASEVKELARQTGMAIDDIHGRVERIQGATNGINNTITRICESFDKVQEVTGAASNATKQHQQSASETRTELMELVKSTDDAMSRISLSIDATDVIVGEVMAIRELLHSAKINSDETQFAGDDVLRVADGLRLEMNDLLIAQN